MSVNITIDDTSPLVHYSSGGAGWDIRQNASDSTLYNGTYHKATSTSATVTLDFSGSSITVYGRSNRGYIASVDSTLNFFNESLTVKRGSNVLFHADDLDFGFHTVYVGNFGNFEGPELDFELDSFVVGAKIGQENGTLPLKYIESDDPVVKGFGNVSTIAGGRNGTSLYATGANSGISFSFTGASLAIYSPPWNPSLPSPSQYSVYINSSTIPPGKNDKPFTSYPGSTNGAGELRFFANGLSEGQHTVAIVNYQGSFGFDYATYTRPDRYVHYSNVCWANCATTGVDSTKQQGPGYVQSQQPQQTQSSFATQQITAGTGRGIAIGLLLASLMALSTF
ncbi:hypothetical protein CI109_102864 [Kwoniella shandongensis]|uniref:Uncharacterized protein n=1 Tax=Kwoniella shandongensis TaxID=1734106 RepID=A0A5M6C7V2_9TREE|nr:uncharacterized protein CI109_000054 [Kwoniella shandongensis]KAA5531216.1 hypothetical protein CI109_000054 [Kwoniella shandongensis]